MTAAITAGGRVAGALAAAMGTEVKALARYGGVALIDRAVDAARGAGAGRVVVVGGDEVRTHVAGRAEIVEAAEDGRENLSRAIAAARDEPLLLLASDLPFVAADDVAAFLRAAAGADVAMPLAAERAYAAAFPGAPPHVVDVGGERVANGSVFYFAPGVAPRALAVAQRLFAARKSLVRLASLLGPGLLVRYAMRRLTIAHVEARAERVLGLRALAVRDCAPGLCFDVDTVDDDRYARDHAR